MKNYPTPHLYYGKYMNCYHIGPYTSVPPALLPREFSGKYKTVKHHVDNYTKIKLRLYTNDKDVIEFINTNKYIQIIESYTPISEEHEQYLLKNDRNLILREKLYYNKYKHKVELWHMRSVIDRDGLDDIMKDVYGSFSKKGRVVHKMGGYYNVFKFGPNNRTIVYDYLPNFYTNDERELMLFKLKYSDRLDIIINTVILVEDLKD